MSSAARSRNAAAAASPPRAWALLGGALELGGDRLVGTERASRPMPGAPVRVPIGVSRFGQSAVYTPPILVRRRSVGRRADERVREPDASADVEQPRIDRRPCRGHVQSQDLHRAPQQEWIPQGLRRGGEDEQLRLGGKRRQACGVALLDLGGNRMTRRKAEPAGNVREIPGARQLEEGERVAMALGDDLVADCRVEPALQLVQQECACVAGAEARDLQRRHPGEHFAVGLWARRAHEGDPFGE